MLFAASQSSANLGSSPTIVLAGTRREAGKAVFSRRATKDERGFGSQPACEEGSEPRFDYALRSGD